MQEMQISKEKVDQVLFRFLQSMYLFENREMSLFGVSWDEVYLLQLLIRLQKMSVSEVANRLKIPVFVASRMITRLEREGLVQRMSSDTDKRVVLVEITSDGREKIVGIEQYNYEVVARSFERLSDQEVHVLMNSIEKLDEFLGLE